MVHYAVRIKLGFRLRRWEELLDLWNRLTVPLQGARAVCLMLTHFHALAEKGLEGSLGRALSGHTRAARARGLDFPGWERVSHDGEVVSRQKIRRSIRYIVLNPCRARLVHDPLQWPYSTHREMCGLVHRPIREKSRDATGFHAYASSDPTVAVGGTPFPAYEIGECTLFDVEAAVSEWLRVPLPLLRMRGMPRRYFMGMARALGHRPVDVARFAGVSKAAAGQAPLPSQREIDGVRLLLCDSRFPGLTTGWIRTPSRSLVY